MREVHIHNVSGFCRWRRWITIGANESSLGSSAPYRHWLPMATLAITILEIANETDHAVAPLASLKSHYVAPLSPMARAKPQKRYEIFALSVAIVLYYFRKRIVPL